MYRFKLGDEMCIGESRGKCSGSDFECLVEFGSGDTKPRIVGSAGILTCGFHRD